MKRAFDLLFAAILLPFMVIPFIVIATAVKFTSNGPVLYWSERIGKGNLTFRMPKFRSMLISTPTVATHMLENPHAYYTRIGSVLRNTSLDEIPQIWCILKGDMSFVGPRPALYNQTDLIELRTSAGVHSLTPGLTGWAQINGRDDLPIPQKVALDAEYLQRAGLAFDLLILSRTVSNVLLRKGILH
jgi:O-antigen biosynthesis protein WbqP